MKRINAIGYYGWLNFGDELFRESIQLNKKLLWGEDVVVRSFIFPIKSARQNEGLVGRSVRALEDLLGGLWGEVIAYCGGSIFEDLGGTQRLREKIFRRSRVFEAIGVSLGPWESDLAKERVLEHITSMRRVVVRDSASMVRGGDTLRLGADLAALYPMPELSIADRRGVTICVSNDSGVSAEQLADFLHPLLAIATEPITLLALNVRPVIGDVELSEAVSNLLADKGINAEVVLFTSVQQTIQIISQSCTVWSQRLHGVITAYLCGVPILALGHHSKIIDFADDISLDQSAVSELTVVSEELIIAARTSLEGEPNWGVSTTDYIQRARSAFESI